METIQKLHGGLASCINSPRLLLSRGRARRACSLSTWCDWKAVLRLSLLCGSPIHVCSNGTFSGSLSLFIFYKIAVPSLPCYSLSLLPYVIVFVGLLTTSF